MILLLVMNAFLALLFTLDKEVLNFLPPMVFLATRTMICGMIFFAFYWFSSHRQEVDITWQDIGRKLLLAFFNIYVVNVMFFHALTSLSSAKASLIYNSKPFIVSILAYFLLRDSISWRKAIGLVIGWLGFIPILFCDNPVQDGVACLSWGELYALGAAFSVSISYIIYNKIMMKDDSSVALTSAINLFCGGSMALVHSCFTEFNSATLATITFNPYVAFLFVSCVAVTIGWAVSFTYLTSRYPSGFLAATGFTTSLFTAIFEWSLFGRTVSYTFYVTLTCVAIGLLFIYKAEQKKIAKIHASQ